MLSIAIQHFIVAVTETNARKALRANSKMRRRSLIPHLVKYTRKAYTNKKKRKIKIRSGRRISRRKVAGNCKLEYVNCSKITLSRPSCNCLLGEWREVSESVPSSSTPKAGGEVPWKERRRAGEALAISARSQRVLERCSLPFQTHKYSTDRRLAAIRRNPVISAPCRPLFLEQRSPWPR